MSAPEDLTPQEPGVVPTADQDPAMGDPVDDMQRLADDTAANIVDTLPALSDDEIESLAVYEQHGKARKTVLAAIEDELTKRSHEPVPPATTPQAPHAAPSRFSRPILTAAGWVVPEPHQLPEA